MHRLLHWVFLFMAKELPYFKFEPQAWDTGNIQMCSLECQGLFINLCAIYWSRLGELPYRLALVKTCHGDSKNLDILIESGLIKKSDDLLTIDFLDKQLEEFQIISSKRAQAGKKGGENRILSPEIARIKGRQIYVIHCFDDHEEFIKVGITSESISRRFSGKMPYEYDVLFQFLTDGNLDLESQCNEILYRNHGYKPKTEFVGYLECFKMSVFDELNDIIKQRTGNAIAMPKQRNAIREDKIREKKKREDESGAGEPATIEQRASEFMDKVAKHLNGYSKEMLRDFYDYWTEKNEGGRKMRFEMQKVFDIGRRLKTWDSNEKKNGSFKNKRSEHLNGLKTDFAKRASESN